MLSIKTIDQYTKQIQHESKSKLLDNSISNNSINDLFINRNVINDYNFVFSDKLSTKNITNQYDSGRCWLFAFVNIMRDKMIKKYKLKDNFKLSTVYLFFYDKLEKSNYFLRTMFKLKDKDIASRELQYLLKNPLNDGGTWEMASNILLKYGIVPFSNMKDTLHSEDTEELNKYLEGNLRRFAHTIRENKNIDIDKMVFYIYKLLCSFLGTPPTDYKWSYYNSKDKYKKTDNLTPMTFYTKYIKSIFNPSDYVTCINFPIKKYPYNKTYTITHCTNMIDKHSLLLNLNTEDFIYLLDKSIKQKEHIWFGSDVNRYYEKGSGILDTEIFDYKELYDIDELSKGNNLIYNESKPDHAMVIVGYNLEDKQINKYLVENSWGKNENAKDEDTDSDSAKGYLAMSKSWVKKYVYLAVIHKKCLSKAQRSYLSKKSKQTNPWDILSCELLRQ